MNADTAADIWTSLPVPAFVIDLANQILAVNPAAEVFLNLAQKSLIGREIDQCLQVDIDLHPNLSRARLDQSVLFHHDVTIDRVAGGIALCDVQLAPMSDAAKSILVLLHPRQIKGQLGRALQVKSSAKTAIGLADMLAHEIKNPLAGINGAAQLLAMGLNREDREMTD
ncbi:MAG: two-component system nitrogen regulation sensor histidine kinase GlnL, partial [Planctomycetota bacterium]